MLDQDHSYLRVHKDDVTIDPIHHNLTSFPLLAQHFEALTGWTIAYRETTASRVRRQNHPGQFLPIFGKLVIEDLSPMLKPSERASSRAKSEALLNSLNQILGELDESRDQIWRQDALLATGIPVTVHGDFGEKLAILLQSLLRSAADAVQCDAAALYMLDDATQQLDLRCQVAPSGSQSFEASRELRTCKADLEALLGNAVVLEDTDNYRQWRIPRECGSAVCLPVASANALLGSFWVHCPHPRPFNGAEINVLEIIAGRIATELERFALIQSMQCRHLDRPTPPAGPNLPNIPPPIEELRIHGEANQGSGGIEPGAVYDWSICKQGRLAFLVGFAPDESANPGIAATILQTAFRAHSAHCRTAAELFDAIFETSITVSSGLDPVRFICGYVDPTSGNAEYASTETTVGFMRRGEVQGLLILEASATASGEFGIAHCGEFQLLVGIPVELQIQCGAHALEPVHAPHSLESEFDMDQTTYVDDFHLPTIGRQRAPRPLVRLRLELARAQPAPH